MINHCWNWRDFCFGGNKQPQPDLVPSPDKVELRPGPMPGSKLFTVQHCRHISCWPCTEMTDACGHAPGLSLSEKLV